MTHTTRLILTRRQGQALYIGDDITVTIVGAHGPVKIAIEAPPEVSIERDDMKKTKPKGEYQYER